VSASKPSSRISERTFSRADSATFIISWDI
jgi:hypothetical protein